MSVDNELMHYGVLGMKWGVRRYQDKSGRRTAAGKEHRVSRDELTKICEIAGGYGKGFVNVSGSSVMVYDRMPKKFEVELRGSSIGKTKYGDISNQISGAEERQIDKETGFPKKASKMSIEDDMVSVNRDSKGRQIGTVNCVLCSTAYDLRRRGLDVVATDTNTGRSAQYAASFYKNSKLQDLKKSKSYNQADKAISDYQDRKISREDAMIAIRQAQKTHVADINAALRKQGEGARGNIMVMWTSGGGHSMAYEVRNGKVMIVDAQVGRVHDLDQLSYWIHPMGTEYVRTDNCKLSPAGLKYAAANADVKHRPRSVISFSPRCTETLKTSKHGLMYKSESSRQLSMKDMTPLEDK